MLQPGTLAPTFALPRADTDGVVSLAEYRGRASVLLALFRGLYCPFSRQQMAQLAKITEKLRPLGVETLGVVATAAERARSYFRRVPTRLVLASDPDLTTHRAYGLDQWERNAETAAIIEQAAHQFLLELGIPPAPPGTSRDVLDRTDGWEPADSDRADRQRHRIQLIGQFLIDRAGVIRWSSDERTAGYAVFPSEKQLLPAIESLRLPT
jgi:peroxiredoxin